MTDRPDYALVAVEMDTAAAVMDAGIDRAVAIAPPGAPLDWDAFYPTGAGETTRAWIDTILRMQLDEINADLSPDPTRPAPSVDEFFGLLPGSVAADWVRGASAHIRHLANGVRAGRPDLLLAIDAS